MHVMPNRDYVWEDSLWIFLLAIRSSEMETICAVQWNASCNKTSEYVLALDVIRGLPLKTFIRKTWLEEKSPNAMTVGEQV